MACRWERSNGLYLVPFDDGLEQYEPLYRIPISLFALNRNRLAAALKAAGKDCVVLLHGGTDRNHHSSDTEAEFVQEPYFYWAFGVQEANFLGAVDSVSGKSYLFIPKLPETYAVWFGTIYPESYYKTKYGVDEVLFTDDIASKLKEIGGTIFVIQGLDTDSGSITEPATFKGIEDFAVDKDALHPILSELRVFKTEPELNALRYVARITAKAHVEIMQTIKAGQSEHQIESSFKHFSFCRGGCRHVSYCCIAATGVDNATLHYPLNDKRIEAGSLALFDMGAKYESFCSDVTCSFPVTGKFTPEQRIVYEAVLASNIAVMQMMKPGACWKQCHLKSTRVILEHLVKAKLIHGDVEEMMKVHFGSVFMPHGLGHFIGLQTHDVGGYNKGAVRETAPGLSKLRTGRVLEAGMYITNEPGCYFNHFALEQAFKNPEFAKFMDEKLIREKYWDIGGVRIEDDVLITANGCEVFSNVPRTVADIERVLAGEKWENYGTITYINQ